MKCNVNINTPHFTILIESIYEGPLPSARLRSATKIDVCVKQGSLYTHHTCNVRGNSFMVKI